jgi:pimeloyl-ACP methyl ester carboxylesterase
MPVKNVNGANLFYEETGSGEPLLFHHGYTGSHHGWDGVIPIVAAAGYRCIAMDCRGACDSEHTTEGYSIAQYARDAVGMADALGLDRFTYIGHSMGGVIGMQLALTAQSRLNRLVLVAPAPADGVSHAQAAVMHEIARDRRARGAKDELLEERLLLTARERPLDDMIAEVDRNLGVSAGHFADSWRELVDFRVGDRLREIAVPTLMMAGAADGLLEANLKDFQRLPDATLHVFSRVSHGLPYEIPGEFAAVLLDFLEHGVVTARTLQAKMRERAGVR